MITGVSFSFVAEALLQLSFVELLSDLRDIFLHDDVAFGYSLKVLKKSDGQSVYLVQYTLFQSRFPILINK